MTDAEVNKARVSFIEAVQKLGTSLEDHAQIAAVQAVRKPGDKMLMEMAREAVLRHDTRRETTDDVIKLVWKFWPVQKPEVS